MNAPTTTAESTALIATERQQFDLSPRNFDEAWRMAEYLADSEMVPKDFRGKPANCLVAIQWGAELGLKTMQAIQNIAVINGRPSLWGDVMLALVRNSPLCEYVTESWEGNGDSLKAVCKAKRRGEPEQVRDFSMTEAKTANLLGKDTYKQYGKRMLQMRARAWALRDVFTDLLKGLHMAEEAMDMPPTEKHMGPADVVQPTGAPSAPPPPPAAPAQWTDDDMAKREPKIREFYSKGKTADDIIAFYATKTTLSDAHQQRIRALAPAPATAADAADQVQDAVPKVTYAQVAEKITAAEDLDQLDSAKALIASVADAGQREELTALATKRGADLPF